MAINACHCDDCRKLTGAANLLMVIGPRDADSARKEGDVVRWRKTADSGRQIDIVRCAACGTRLWHEPLAAPALIYIAAGTLDHPGWAVPTSHMYGSQGGGEYSISSRTRWSSGVSRPSVRP